jgi:hypothetical protein
MTTQNKQPRELSTIFESIGHTLAAKVEQRKAAAPDPAAAPQPKPTAQMGSE